MHGRRFTDVVKDRVAGATRSVARAMPTKRDIRRRTDRLGRWIHDYPISAAIGATVIGFLVGAMLPATRVETDRIRDVRRAARDASAEAIEAGRELVLETVWTTLGSRRTNGPG
ncbi:MAG TPA: hypothetical protein VEV38_13605 [Candidatus Eremiobacteraceae bacterium]|nr:hypothetical protein [Candidatus Eremiobacteraceae bacterium]